MDCRRDVFMGGQEIGSTGGSDKIAAFVMAELVAAFAADQEALFVFAFAAFVGEFEAAVVVEVVVALGAFMAVLAGHALPSFRRPDASIFMLHNMCGNVILPQRCPPGGSARELALLRGIRSKSILKRQS